MTAVRRALLACLLLLLAAPAAALAGSSGGFDPAFGPVEDGSVILDPDGEPSAGTGEGAERVFALSGGKALAVGDLLHRIDDDHAETTAALLRLTAAGEPDAAYGTGGVRRLPAALGTVADAVEVGGGQLVLLLDPPDGAGYALVRVDMATGAVDPSFGTEGIVRTGFSDFEVPASQSNTVTGGALERLGAGYLVVGADVRTSWSGQYGGGSDWHAGLARYTLDGRLDGAWGEQSGTTTITAPADMQPYRVEDLAVEPSGRVSVVFTGNDPQHGYTPRTAVARVDDDGALDATFGDQGVAPVRLSDDDQAGETLHAAVADAQGRLWLAGQEGVVFTRMAGVVARLDDTGSLDPSFDDDGVTRLRAGRGDRGFESMTPDGDTLLVAGHTRPLNGEDGDSGSWLTRWTDDGLDTTFGTAGEAIGGSLFYGEMDDIALTGDGFALLAGFEGSSSSGNRWSFARVDRLDERTPVNHAVPVIGDGGFVAPGESTAVTTPGSWWYGGTVTRRWQRCDDDHQSGESPATDTGCTDIAGATGTSYVVTDADRGKALRVVETNTNGTLAATAASATQPVADPATPPAFTADPAVTPSGSVPAGTVVRATWGESGDVETRTVTWYQCDTASGAPCRPAAGDDPYDDEYRTAAGDAGHWMRAVVELSGRGGFQSRETTNGTAVTAAGTATAPAATAAPALDRTGSVEAGTTLMRASDGAWDQAGLTFGYRWERCDGADCTAIPGAGGASYVTGAADAGHGVRLVVDARRGDGPVGSAASPATAVTAKPAPPAPAPPAPQPPAAPARVPLRSVDTTVKVQMPEVRGLQADEARRRIEAAGIHAVLDVKEAVRAKPLKLPGKPRLDVGDVSGQSIAAGTAVTSSIGAPKPIRLVTEAGPKATRANGGPSGPACTGKAVRADYKGASLEDVLELLQVKRCTKLDVDFVVSRGAKDLQIVKAAKEGGELALTVKVPGAPGELDLVPVFRQGAFNGNPSFDRDRWALTAGTTNVLGVQTVNSGGTTVAGAEVLLDGSDVGVDDIHERARGPVWVRGLQPRRPGVVNVVVMQEDATGSNRLFGFGRFKVEDRKGAFTGIDGRRYGPSGKALTTAPVARAAGFGDVLAALGDLAAAFGQTVSRIFSGPVSESTLSTAAKQQVGLAQLSFGQVLNGGAGVVAAGGGNVVAAGGANVVAAGGANVVAPGGANVLSTYGAGVVAAGGGNAISLAGGQVIAAGGGNAIGRSTIDNGTGRLVQLGGAQVIAAGGGNVIAAGGGNVVASGGGN